MPPDELNEQFFEAQRGGYSRDDFGINADIYDDYDLKWSRKHTGPPKPRRESRM